LCPSPRDLTGAGLHLQRLDSVNIEGSDRVEIIAALAADKHRNNAVERTMGWLSLDPAVTVARRRHVVTGE